MNPKSLLAGAAIAGLISGSTMTQAEASTVTSMSTGDPGVSIKSVADKGEHACKGQNACKGQGGCKSGDNGCKGKNSCKGKGGCATDGSHDM